MRSNQWRRWAFISFEKHRNRRGFFWGRDDLYHDRYVRGITLSCPAGDAYRCHVGAKNVLPTPLPTTSLPNNLAPYVLPLFFDDHVVISQLVIDLPNPNGSNDPSSVTLSTALESGVTFDSNFDPLAFSIYDYLSHGIHQLKMSRGSADPLKESKILTSTLPKGALILSDDGEKFLQFFPASKQLYRETFNNYQLDPDWYSPQNYSRGVANFSVECRPIFDSRDKLDYDCLFTGKSRP